MGLMTTINKEEIQKFSRMADEWWDANGKFKPLHAFNPVRIEYIKNNCMIEAQEMWMSLEEYLKLYPIKNILNKNLGQIYNKIAFL